MIQINKITKSLIILYWGRVSIFTFAFCPHNLSFPKFPVLFDSPLTSASQSNHLQTARHITSNGNRFVTNLSAIYVFFCVAYRYHFKLIGYLLSPNIRTLCDMSCSALFLMFILRISVLFKARERENSVFKLSCPSLVFHRQMKDKRVIQCNSPQRPN